MLEMLVFIREQHSTFIKVESLYVISCSPNKDIQIVSKTNIQQKQIHCVHQHQHLLSTLLPTPVQFSYQYIPKLPKIIRIIC